MATSNTRDAYPLSRKKILKKAIERTQLDFIAWTLLSLLVHAVLFYASVEGGGVRAPLQYFWQVELGIVFLCGALFIPRYFYQSWYFATYFYDLTDDHVVIRKGPITPREITVPYERIQDVYVDQDIWDRIFGLYDVHISSATASSGFAAHIDGVEKSGADGLRALILSKVKEKIGRK